MKCISLFSFALAAVLMLSCSKDKTTEVDPNAPVAVQFSSGIQVQSKASGTTWDDNDAIGIYMKEAGKDLADGFISEEVKNISYFTTTATLGQFKPSGAKTIYYPVNTPSSVDFVAYYPFTGTISSSYVYPITTATQTSQKAIDLMFSNNAAGKAKSTTSVNLDFYHMLSKLEFNLIKDASVVSITGAVVTIKNIQAEGGFDLTNAAKLTFESGNYPDLLTSSVLLTVNSPNVDVTCFKTDDKAEAILFPQSVSEKFVHFAITTGTGSAAKTETYKWQFPTSFKLEPGKKYIYNVTIKNTEAVITGTIVNWAPVTTENITAV